MVRIRLRRTGKKKQASYRVVVADSESPRDGRFIETLGVIEEDTVVIHIVDGERPCLLEGAEDQSFLSIIMPMRI